MSHNVGVLLNGDGGFGEKESKAVGHPGQGEGVWCSFKGAQATFEQKPESGREWVPWNLQETLPGRGTVVTGAGPGAAQAGW